MADINEKLNQTEQNLKNTETQAKKTEQAVRKVSEAELEADMRAAQMYVKPDKNKALEERSRLLAEGQKVAAERRMLLNGMERHMDRAKSMQSAMQSANSEAQAISSQSTQSTVEFISDEEKRIDYINKEKAAMEQLYSVYERVQKSKNILNDVINAFTGLPVDKFFDLVQSSSNSLYGFKSEEVAKSYAAKDNNEAVMSIDGKKYRLTIDEDKIIGGDAQREALSSFMKFINELDNVITNIHFLNSTSRANLLATDTKTPLNKYKNVYEISSSKGSKTDTGVDYVTRDGFTFKIDSESLDKIDDTNKVFAYNFQQRLNGFTDENGQYKIGYRDIADNLEKLEQDIIRELPKMSLFSKATSESMSGAYGTKDKDILNEVIAQRLINFGIDKMPDELTEADRVKALSESNGTLISQLLERIMTKDIDAYSAFIGNAKQSGQGYGKLSIDTTELNDAQRALFNEEFSRLNEFFKSMDSAFSYYKEVNKAENQIELKDGGYAKNKSVKDNVDVITDIETHVQNFNTAIDMVEEGVRRYLKAIESGDINEVKKLVTDDIVAQLPDSRKRAADELALLQNSQYADSLATLKDANGNLMADLDGMSSKLETLSEQVQYVDFSRINDGIQNILSNAKEVEKLETTIKAENTQRNKDAVTNSFGDNKIKEFNLENEIKQIEYLNSSGLLNNTEIDNNNQKLEILRAKLNETRETLTSLRTEADNAGADITQQEKNIEDMLNILKDGIGIFGVGYVGMMSQLSRSKAGGTLDNIRQAAKDNGVQNIVGSEQYIAEDLLKLRNDIGKIVVSSVYDDLTNQVKSLPKGQTKQLNILNNLRGNLGNIITGKDVTQLEGYKSRSELEDSINSLKGDLDVAKEALEQLKLKNTDGNLDDKIHNFEKTLNKLNDKYTYILSGYSSESSYDELEKAYRSSIPLSSDISGFTSDVLYAAQKASANAPKETNDAQKQWEEQVNKLRNKVSEVTNYIKQAVANTVKVIRAANNVVNKSISVMIGAFDKLGSAVQRIIQLFGNFGNRVTGFNKQGNILKGTFTELKSKVDLLVGAFNKLYNNSFINEGKKLLSSVQTLNMLIGTELTTQTMEWATNLEHAFGLSAAGLIADLKELTAVMYGLGMTSQDVQVAATNLEAVAMSLSATTGYDFSTVVNKIQSGMKGMTQSIDDLGLSVRESQMDAFLKKLKAQGGEYANIGTSFSQLEEQQRIYVRYAAIMDQFTSKDAYSAENYAKSLRTITGSLSILNSQLRGLKSDIGSLALQLFAKIIQPLIYIIYLVRQAIAGLANLLGIDITLNPKINNSEDVVAPIEDVTDALDEEAAAADKAKGSLDSLDHVSTMSESKNSKKGDDFDYSSLMNISDDYAKLLEDLGKMQDDFIEECKEKFWKMVNDIKDKFTAWIKRITGRLIDWDAIKANWEIIKENLQKTWDNIVRIFKAGTDIIGGLLYSIFDDLDGTTLLAKLSDIIERFTRLIALILERVQPKIQAFYDKYVSKYVIKAGEKIKQVLDDVIAKLDEWIKWWEDPKNEGAINEWFENAGNKFESFMKTIKHIFIVFKSLVKGEGGLTLDERIETVDMSDGMKSMQEIAFSLHNILADVANVIKQVVKNLLDLNDDGVLNKDDLQIALDNIKEKLQDIEKWLNDNKEKIETLLTTAAETVGKLVGAKFDILMQLLEFITNNADTINVVLQTLQNVIEFVTEHPVIAATIAIGVQVAGHVIKGAATAAMWSTILGAGSISEAFAGIAAAITGPIGIIIAILATAVAWFTLIWTKSEWFRGAVSSGIEEIKKCWDDNVQPIKDNLDKICEVLEDLGIDLDNLFWNDLMQLIYKDTLRGQIFLVKAAITLLLSPLQAITGVLSGIFGLAKNIKQLFTDIKNFDFGDTLQNLAKVTGTGGLLGNKYVINGIKKVKSFYGDANGGVPSSGSLFLANENGNAELVGNFGGYTGVANQDMIIKAMQNAMVQAIKSAGGFGQSGSVVNNYNIGTMIGDDSSYRQLARKLNTINERSNSNIANVGFVMS